MSRKSGEMRRDTPGASPGDSGSAEAVLLLALLCLFFLLSLIFMATGDGFCFEYC